MNSPALFDVRVGALGGLGDGLSSLNGKPLFIEKAAADDILKIRVVHETKEALRGEIVEILEGGPDRINPPCTYFSACGGCNMQQLSENAYRDFKRRVLRDALAHGGFPDTDAQVHFLPAASRRRVELKVSFSPSPLEGEGGVGGDTHSGAGASVTPHPNPPPQGGRELRFAFYAPRSRDLVPVERCVILEPVLQALMPRLAKALGEWHAVRAIKTVSLTAADSGIDMVLECSSLVENTNALSVLAETLDIGRISLDAPGQALQVVTSRMPITMRLGEYDIALPAKSFLQASREGQRLLTEAVLSAFSPWEKGGASRDEGSPHPLPKGGGIRVADLFCGIGTYSFPLSKNAQVHAVESDGDMVRNLKAMTHLHAVNRKLSAEQRDLFKRPITAKELAKYDAAIINPPRPGAKKQCEEIAKSTISKVVMVSCNPASFARDAKILKAGGFTLHSAQAIDQFVYSAHLEIVAVFGR